MKSVKKTVSIAQLNSGNEIKLDVTIIDENSILQIPRELLAINNSGAEIGYLYIDNDEENNLRPFYSGFYQFIPFDTGRGTGELPSSINYIIIKKLSGTATAAIELYFTSYSDL